MFGGYCLTTVQVRNSPHSLVPSAIRLYTKRMMRPVIRIVSQNGLALVIAGITLAVFAPALWNDFVNWDDPTNFLYNPNYRGLGWKQLRWMFTSSLMGHWVPLTWITLGLDYVVWGMNPLGYHLTNLLLHAANAAVFYLVACRLLGKAMGELGAVPLRLGAGAAALFFALHPLRAESVAWVTERRDVLSGLFFLLTILLYLRACEAEGARRRRWLSGSLGCYVLALASKASVVALPVVLIVLDIYPLGRLGGRWRDWTSPEARRVWKEKVPFFLLALVGGAIALSAVWGATALTRLDARSLPARVAALLWSLSFYVWKTLSPTGLSPLYALPARIDPLAPRFVWGALAVGIFTGVFWALRRRWPAGLAVWATYVVMLTPLSAQLHAGYQLTADRYSYLACLGWALLAGAGVCAISRALHSGLIGPRLARAALAIGAIWIGALATMTWNQVQVWRDSDTLWQYALEEDPHCFVCHSQLGVSLSDRGLFAQAIGHFERALAERPRYALARSHLAVALLRNGEPAKARTQFEQVLSQVPGAVSARTYLGEALVRQGELREAVTQLRLVIQGHPDYVVALTYLGMALVELGGHAEAIPYFQRAIMLEPVAPLPRFGLARAYLGVGNTTAAREQTDILQRLDPALARQLPQE